MTKFSFFGWTVPLMCLRLNCSKILNAGFVCSVFTLRHCLCEFSNVFFFLFIFTNHLNSYNHSHPIPSLSITFTSVFLSPPHPPRLFLTATTSCHPACKMNFKNLLEYLAWLYYQYLLITGIYVLEPWEKSIFNSILFSAIAMVIYTSYVFVPIHVRLALEFFSGIFGGQPESTMALMN